MIDVSLHPSPSAGIAQGQRPTNPQANTKIIPNATFPNVSPQAPGRTGGQKPKLTPRQARIAQQMYEETGPDGRRTHTVAQIAAEFGVTRPTIYRHLASLPTETPTTPPPLG